MSIRLSISTLKTAIDEFLYYPQTLVNSPNNLYHMNIVEEKLKFNSNDILIIV